MNPRVTRRLMNKFPVIGDIVKEYGVDFVEYEGGITIKKNSNPPITKGDKITYICFGFENITDLYVQIYHYSGKWVEFKQKDLTPMILRIERFLKIITVGFFGVNDSK